MREFDTQAPDQAKASKLLRKYEEGRFPFSAAALDYHQILSRAQIELANSRRF